MQHSEQINELAAALAKAQGVFWWGPPDLPEYLVSECGEVLSLVRRPRLLRPIRLGKYRGFQLRSKSGALVKRYIHRLVAEHAYGPPCAGQEVRHLDGNRHNNRFDNLAWGTRRENHADKRQHGTDAGGERNPNARLTHREVEAMREIRQEQALSYEAIGRQFGVSTMTAYRAIRRQSWK